MLWVSLSPLISSTDESLLRMQKIQAIKRPTERAQRNMFSLISNTQSLVKDESDWIREGPDLAALGQGNEHGWLNTFLEDLLNTISRRMTMVSSLFHLRMTQSSAGFSFVCRPSLTRYRRSSAAPSRSSKPAMKNSTSSLQIVSTSCFVLSSPS